MTLTIHISISVPGSKETPCLLSINSCPFSESLLFVLLEATEPLRNQPRRRPIKTRVMVATRKRKSTPLRLDITMIHILISSSAGGGDADVSLFNNLLSSSVDVVGVVVVDGGDVVDVVGGGS